MNYRAIGDSSYISSGDKVELEMSQNKERAYISYAYCSAYDSMMKSAAEAFIAGLDNVAFYLRDQAKILLEKSNEPWGN